MKGIILGLLFLALLWRPDPAQANFYQGKTVTIISGTTAGSREEKSRVMAPKRAPISLHYFTPKQ